MATTLEAKGGWGRIHRGVFLALLYALVSAAVQNTFMHAWSFRDGAPRFGFQTMLVYAADKPWAGRILTPWTVNTLFALLPAKRAVTDWVYRHPYLYARYVACNPNLERDDWKDPAYAIKYHIAYGLDTMALFATLVLVRLLTKAVYPQDPLARDLGPVLFAVLLPITFAGYGGFVYDFPDLMLLFLTLYLWGRGWHFTFVALIPLLVLNKESSVLWPMACAPFVLGAPDPAIGGLPLRPVERTLVFVGLATGVALVFSVALRVAFSNNPASWVEFNLSRNLDFWTSREAWFGFDDLYAPFCFIPRAHTVWLAPVFLGFALSGWRGKPAPVRHSLAISAAFNLPLLVLFGYHGELRALSMTFPFLYLAAIETFTRPYRMEAGSAARAEPDPGAR